MAGNDRVNTGDFSDIGNLRMAISSYSHTKFVLRRNQHKVVKLNLNGFLRHL